MRALYAAAGLSGRAARPLFGKTNPDFPRGSDSLPSPPRGRRAGDEGAPADEPRFTYTGQGRDPLTGLAHFRARDYDPAAGRFLVPDPLGLAAGDPNLYRYVGNRPLDLTDPSGLTAYRAKDSLGNPPGPARAGTANITWIGLPAHSYGSVALASPQEALKTAIANDASPFAPAKTGLTNSLIASVPAGGPGSAVRWLGGHFDQTTKSILVNGAPDAASAERQAERLKGRLPTWRSASEVARQFADSRQIELTGGGSVYFTGSDQTSVEYGLEIARRLHHIELAQADIQNQTDGSNFLAQVSRSHALNREAAALRAQFIDAGLATASVGGWTTTEFGALSVPAGRGLDHWVRLAVLGDPSRVSPHAIEVDPFQPVEFLAGGFAARPLATVTKSLWSGFLTGRTADTLRGSPALVTSVTGRAAAAARGPASAFDDFLATRLFRSDLEARKAYEVYQRAAQAQRGLVIGHRNAPIEHAFDGWQALRMLEDSPAARQMQSVTWTEEINMAWIDGAIDAGKPIKLVTPFDQVRRGTVTWREVQRVISRGGKLVAE